MSVTTYNDISRTKRDPEAGGWFSKLMERIVEAQAARVRRDIYAQLRGFSDDTLSRLGFSADEITRLRRGEYVKLAA